MGDESFFGVTLDKKENVVEWNAGPDDEYSREHKLTIKQILLGAEAAADEFNVVEAEIAKDSQKIPIAVLKAGETRALNPNIEFFDNVKFQLIKGSGPVYIHGTLIKDVVEVVDWEGDEEDDGEEEEEADEDEAQPKKKQKIENNSYGKNAKPKKK